MKGRPSPDELPPGPDRLLDRRERSAHQDRGRDHHTRRDFLIDGKPGARTENGHLKGHSQSLGAGGQDARAIAGLGLKGKPSGVPLGPAALDAIHHAHGLDGFGVAQAGLGKRIGGQSVAVGGAKRFPGQKLGQKGDREQDDRTDQCDQPEHRVKQKDDPDIEGHPGGVEQGKRAGPGQKLPEAIEIAQPLDTFAEMAAQTVLERRQKDLSIQALVDLIADAHENPRADELEQSHDQEHAAG